MIHAIENIEKFISEGQLNRLFWDPSRRIFTTAVMDSFSEEIGLFWIGRINALAFTEAEVWYYVPLPYAWYANYNEFETKVWDMRQTSNLSWYEIFSILEL